MEKTKVFRSMTEIRRHFFPKTGKKELTPEDEAKRIVHELNKQFIERLAETAAGMCSP